MAQFATVLASMQKLEDVMSKGKEMMKEVNVSEKDTKRIPVHCNLAASYGTLTSASIKELDENLKVMIAGTLRKMGKLPDYNWDTVVSCMMQNPLLERIEDSLIHRADKLIKKGSNFFKFSGEPDQTIVREVRTWFVNLIADDDVLKDTKIDIDFLADIVAQTGATVDSFLTLFGKHERHERDLVDIGILRYPEKTMPYFKLYRIKVTAWSDCTRILFAQDDSNGITGEYHCQKFKPCDEVIAKMKPAIIEKAVDEAESIFD